VGLLTPLLIVLNNHNQKLGKSDSLISLGPFTKYARLILFIVNILYILFVAKTIFRFILIVLTLLVAVLPITFEQ
jgi:hypothetical protein